MYVYIYVYTYIYTHTYIYYIDTGIVFLISLFSKYSLLHSLILSKV